MKVTTELKNLIKREFSEKKGKLKQELEQKSKLMREAEVEKFEKQMYI